MLWNLKCNFKLLPDLLAEDQVLSLVRKDWGQDIPPLPLRRLRLVVDLPNLPDLPGVTAPEIVCTLWMLPWKTSGNSITTHVTTTKTWGEEIENIVGHLPCMRLIYVHDCWHCGKPKTINPPFEDGLYHPFRVLLLGWTHCNPLSQHHQPIFNDKIILETLGLHSAWRSIRQQRKFDDERLGVDIWQLRFCEMLHLQYYIWL